MATFHQGLTHPDLWTDRFAYCFYVTRAPGIAVRATLYPAMRQAKLWCAEHFGSRWVLEPRWSALRETILVRDEQDAFAFKMRWC